MAGSKMTKTTLLLELPPGYERWGVDQLCNHLQELQCTFQAERITGEKLKNLSPADQDKFMICVEERIEKQSKVFNDPIHGHVELHPLLVKIINTPQFNRLRNIKQMGGTYFVFPGACHNRFEHSIGVAHLAGEFAKALRMKQPELNITDQDILCVQIAGLCHDLGHGPFSHLFDRKFISKTNIEWKHEEASVMMFEHLVEKNDLTEDMNLFGLNLLNDMDFIKEMIGGKKINEPRRGRFSDKTFLYQIVANKTNGIDVDKFDYFARDCHHLGIQKDFDHQRFFVFARVCQVDGEMQICSRDKELDNLRDMFEKRCAIHRKACQHRVSQSIEIMIADAFIKADKFIKIRGTDGKICCMSEAVRDMEAYTKLTDQVFDLILGHPSEIRISQATTDDFIEVESCPEVEAAKGLLQRVIDRNFYPCLGEFMTNPSETDCETWKSELAAAGGNKDGTLTAEDFEIQVTSLDYRIEEEIQPTDPTSRSEEEMEPTDPTGRSEEEMQPPQPTSRNKKEIRRIDPISRVYFFKKLNPNKASRLSEEKCHKMSKLLEDRFSEHTVRVYLRNDEKLLAAKRHFAKWCRDKGFTAL